MLPLFHLAFPVMDLETTRAFYEGLLECKVGREDERWVDFDFGRHQITAHLNPEECRSVETNGGVCHVVPVRHFGLILEWDQWHALAEKLVAAEIDFIIEPYVRFKGQPGEQATMFFLDPSGNALEFKSFRDPSAVFAKS